MSSTADLFRQDPARGALVRAVLTSLAVGVLLRLVPDVSRGITALDARDLPGGFPYMYLVLTGLVVSFVLSGNSWTRSSRLTLGLPVPARTAWTVRITSLIIIALASVAALAITTGIMTEPDQSSLNFSQVVLLSAARAAVTSVLILFLFQLPLSQRASIPITAPYVVYMLFAGLLTLVVSAAAVTSIAGTLVLLLMTMSLGTWLVIRVPRTFSVGPSLEESEHPIPDHSDEIASVDSAGWMGGTHDVPRWHLHWVLFRGLKRNVLIWFLLGIVGASFAVATLEFFDGTNAFLPFFFVVLYHLPLFQGAIENMTPYDPLPISRTVLWAHTVGPIAFSAALGVVIAVLIFAANPKPYTQIQFSSCCVQVPWDYWEIARDGQVPTVTSPWGENHMPQAYSLWRDSAASLYNPYDSGPESSPRFIEYQMRRAARAVYGDPLPTAFSDAGYESPSNIVGGAERGAFTIDSTRGRSSSDRIRTAAAALMILCLLIVALMLPALLQYGPWVRRKLFKRASIALIILLVVAAVALSTARLLGWTEVWYLGALISIGCRTLAHSLPLSTPVLWFLCVTFWAGAYLILGRVFSSIEFPCEKTMGRFAEEY
ncbi:MAG: hypothetical protein LJE93_01095 [Acidobacteria bacterium]|jgi:hypothetical protein|nr:hypothetical protein [Acidobacteriota bacterium]